MGNLAVEIAHPKAKTANQRREELRVNALQKHPYCKEIVKRIIEGQSLRQIALWCEKSQSEATQVKQKTYFTWYQDIMTLRKRMRILYKVNELERPMPTPELVEDTLDQIRRDNFIPPGQEEPKFPPTMLTLWNSVRTAIRKVDSEMILKVAFFAQVERLEKLLKKENMEDKLDKDGYKEILALKDIGDALRKFEVGEQVLRGGKSHAYGGEYEPPVTHAAMVTPPVSPTDSNDNSLLARVSRLDEVDRNLLIAASTRVINMIELETQIANTEAGRVETNAGSEAPAGSGVSARAFGEDESAGKTDI